jgi:ABC-type phosphate transport system permease subunit
MTPNDPTDFSALVVVELILLTVITIGFCVPLVQRSVEMNKTFGIRTPKAFTSPENWYAINEYGGKVLILFTIIMCAVCVPLTIIFKRNELAQELMMAAPLAFYIIPMILIRNYGSKLP